MIGRARRQVRRSFFGRWAVAFTARLPQNAGADVLRTLNRLLHGSKPTVGQEAQGRATLWVLHAWVWKDNPTGVFQDFNPRVRLCPDGVPVFGE
jgi:hypothetical protein